jgi:hypothetical protein
LLNLNFKGFIMKNITTLSLITATILLINGCGEQSSPKTTNQVDNPIEQLAKASKKHSKSDWDKINSEIKSLAHKDIFMIIMPTSIKANVDNLTYVGIDKDEAYAVNADIMFDKLNELDLADLDNQVVAECHDDTTCQEIAYKSLESALTIDKDKAYAIAMDIHKDNTQTTMEKLLTDFTCEAGLVKTVQWYGVDDNFSTANGDEIAHPSAQLQSIPSINNGTLVNYDSSEINKHFAEEVKNLPINITEGHFYIGMKNQGDNDRISIGNIDNNTTTLDLYVKDIKNNPDLTKTGEVYHAALSDIHFMDTASTSLKAYANATGRFDVFVQDDTPVDFIAVATCSKPNPITEIGNVVDKFECNEKEGDVFKIIGGTKDAFSPASDQAANPSSSLLANAQPYAATTGYDATQYDKNLLDTLSLPTGVTITKAEFSVGYKPLNSSLHTNDTIHIGKYGVNHAGGRYIFYPGSTPNTQNATEPFWVVHPILDGNGNVVETIRTVNLANISTNTSLNMLNWIQGKSEFEVRIEDDTSVDFVQLNLCAKKK